MSLLDSLYQDLILEHYKRPHNHGSLEDANVVEEGVNPSCGDELRLSLRIESDRIVDVRFEGEGCAISQASASMMTDAIKGRDADEVRRLSGSFKAMIQGEAPAAELGDLMLLRGVSKLHARVKCATLPWTTLDLALEADRS